MPNLLIFVGFYLVCDFEAYFSKINDSLADPSIVNRHEVAGFCLHRMTKHTDYQIEPKGERENEP